MKFKIELVLWDKEELGEVLIEMNNFFEEHPNMEIETEIKVLNYEMDGSGKKE